MWNAEIYNRYGKERMQPSIDLVDRVSFRLRVFFYLDKMSTNEGDNE